jgi:hypothetical protein
VGRREIPGDDFDQGRLAGAVVADQADNLAWCYRVVDLDERVNGAVFRLLRAIRARVPTMLICRVLGYPDRSLDELRAAVRSAERGHDWPSIGSGRVPCHGSA